MPRRAKNAPGNCDGCDKQIDGPFIAFTCRRHSVCLVCAQTMPELVPGWKQSTGNCPYCYMEGAAHIEKIDFTRPLPKNAPKCTQEEAVVPLPGNPICGWPTQYDDIIAIARNSPSMLGFMDFSRTTVPTDPRGPTLDIVNVNGTRTCHVLPINGRITSGLYLDTDKCLICVRHESVVTCHVDPKDTTPSTLQILTSLPLFDPIKVFPMVEFRYGILCARPCRVEMFSRKSIVTEDRPKPKNIVTFDHLPYSTSYENACCTPEGHICVSMFDKISIFDITGARISNVDGSPYITVPDGVRRTASIAVTEDGTIVVTEGSGGVLTYKAGTGWKVVRERVDWGHVCGGVLSDSRLWILNFKLESAAYGSNSVEVFDMVDGRVVKKGSDCKDRKQTGLFKKLRLL